jgi:O-antigen/teichoic acid export membrane protein
MLDFFYFGRWFKDSIFASLLVILPGMVGPFLLSIVMTRSLDPSVRGQLSTVVAGVFIASFLGTLGLPNSLAALASKGEISKKLLLENQIVMLVATSIFSVLVSIFFYVEKILIEFGYFLLILVFTNSICQFVFYSLYVNLAGKFAQKIILTLSTLVINLIAAFVIIVDYVDFSDCLTIYACVSILTTLIAAKLGNKIFLQNPYRKADQPENIWRILSDGFSKFFIYVSAYDSLKLDLIIIYLICSLEELGNYVAISTLCLLISVIQRAFAIYFSPKIFKVIAVSRFGKAITLTLHFVITVSIIGIFISAILNFIVYFLFGEKYFISTLTFIFVWFGNVFFQARKLLFDFYRDVFLSKLIPKSEVFSLLTFIPFMIFSTSKDLLSFSVTYFVSLLFGFYIAARGLQKY